MLKMQRGFMEIFEKPIGFSQKKMWPHHFFIYEGNTQR
jgi:hypothetical protein